MDPETKRQHEKAIKTLQDLSQTLKNLTSELSSEQAEQPNNESPSSCHLSHYRTLPENVSSAYQMVNDGANLIHSTSTKYTLITKIKAEDGISLLEDLLKGSQWIASSALLFHANELGCVCTLRKYVKTCVLSILQNVMNLIESFIICNENETTHEQKTGAIWESCDKLLKVPKGNRNCIRRDILQYVCEVNDTYKEFEDMVQLGPRSEEEEGQETNVDDDWDDFCQGSDQYTTLELSIVQPCLQMIQYTKGVLLHVLKVMDDSSTKLSNDKDTNDNQSIYDFIQKLHELSIVLGNSVTDYGVLLYPPLDVSVEDEHSLAGASDLQRDRIVFINDYILSCTVSLEENEDGVSDGGCLVISKELRSQCEKIKNVVMKQAKIIHNRFDK